MMRKPKVLENRLIDFAVQIINVTESLLNTKAGNHIAGQLLRSGTSPAPNYGEAQSAESRRDFVHKNESRSQGTSRDTGLGSQSLNANRCVILTN